MSFFLIFFVLFQLSSSDSTTWNCTGPWLVEEETHLKNLVSFSSLVVVGKPLKAEYGCTGKNRAYGDFQIEVEEIWKGDCPTRVVVRLPRVANQNLECAHLVDQCYPENFFDGDSYMFVCSGNWDLNENQPIPGYQVPVGGFLLYNKEHDTIQFICSSREIRIENSGKILREQLIATDPEGLFNAADLVVLVENPAIQKSKPDSEEKAGWGGVSAQVTRVLKGDFKEGSLEFGLHGFHGYLSRRIHKTDKALLFLIKNGDHFELVEGRHGYLTVKDGELFDSSKKPSGWWLANESVLKKGPFR